MTYAYDGEEGNAWSPAVEYEKAYERLLSGGHKEAGVANWRLLPWPPCNCGREAAVRMVDGRYICDRCPVDA